LPDHSSLTRIRQRWGAGRFRRIFERTVRACFDAGIAKGEIVHVDASLIRADVRWESLVEGHVEAVAAANTPDDAERHARQTGKDKKVSTTDLDATMATTARNRRLEPSFKQHAAVDDLAGVVLDLVVTTGEVNEGQRLESQIDHVGAVTGEAIVTVTADAGYAYGKVYDALERRQIEALIPAARCRCAASATTPGTTSSNARRAARCGHNGRPSTAASSIPAPGTVGAARCAACASRRGEPIRRS
jgi:hypothetical protein